MEQVTRLTSWPQNIQHKSHKSVHLRCVNFFPFSMIIFPRLPSLLVISIFRADKTVDF